MRRRSYGRRGRSSRRRRSLVRRLRPGRIGFRL